MADRLTPQARSRLMARIRGTNTMPEMAVRSAAHRMGFRFRLHRRDLPGTPDLVFPRLRSVVFVHGCFWHGHGCGWKQASKSRVAYWTAKIRRNKERDAIALRLLRRIGWKTLVVWECEARRVDSLERKLGRFLHTRGER
jgi:DNA mismatch endonuclease (patch repair protein)